MRENIGLICSIAQTVISVFALFNTKSNATIWIILFVVSLIANAVAWHQYRKYKKLYNLMYGNPYFNTIKHLINSRKQKCENKFRLDNLKVSYTLSDNPQYSDLLDNIIQYHLKGKIKTSTAECIILRLSITKSKNIEKITVTGHDNNRNQDVTAQISTVDDGYVVYKVPFVGQRRELDEIDYTVTIKWNRFSGKRITELIILDPFKYAEKIQGNIDIEIKNHSKNFKIDQPSIRTFDRKEFTCKNSFVFDQGDKVNQKFSHTIKEGEFNENSVFGISFGKDTV